MLQKPDGTAQPNVKTHRGGLCSLPRPRLCAQHQKPSPRAAQSKGSPVQGQPPPRRGRGRQSRRRPQGRSPPALPSRVLAAHSARANGQSYGVWNELHGPVPPKPRSLLTRSISLFWDQTSVARIGILRERPRTSQTRCAA